MTPIYCGFDPREAQAFHVFTQSLINTARHPIQVIPLALPLLRDYEETHTDGSNAFIYSRFLVPHMQGYKGWAIFCDGDMLLKEDIHNLWRLQDDRYAVMVVKHDYKTKSKRKYIGSSMETVNPDYPRKNWSSVILWNCAHPLNRLLTPEYVMAATGRQLHAFAHLNDDEIGELPKEWNWLASEYPENPGAKLIHYTLGVPGIRAYADSDHSDEYHETAQQVMHIQE